jgi:hypothetical protein
MYKKYIFSTWTSFSVACMYLGLTVNWGTTKLRIDPSRYTKYVT